MTFDEAWARLDEILPENGLVVSSIYREELGCQPDGTCPYGQWWSVATRDRHDDDPVIGKGDTIVASLVALAEALDT